MGSHGLGLHGDLADRIIVATALEHDATLITADERILSWKRRLRAG
ncbi:MAG TPA: PIN domain-containing protein [Thermoanaerobaculia bacterium]|nr:PIN domain-containing protein [Thermoanaerobaculia bacterium]